MKRIFHQTLNAIQPSDAFLNRLECEMNRALLQRKRRNLRHRAAVRYVGVAAAAVIAFSGAWITFQPSDSAKDPQPLLTAQPSPSADPSPTSAPDIELSSSVSASIDQTQSANNTFASTTSAQLPSFLSDQLALEDVISCTLRYAPTEFSDHICNSEQTIIGETLHQWLLRLGNARFIEVSESVCAQGLATLTLTYADETEIVIDLAGDSCPNILYNNVLYDLRTDEERADHTSGSHCLNDILPHYFDEITFPWK